MNQALDAEPVDENVVNQRINELAAAQAAQLRMRIGMELRIRRLLYPEQLATLTPAAIAGIASEDVINPQRPNRTHNNPRGAR